MIVLLLGPDNFSKKQYIAGLAAKGSSEAVFYDAEMPPALANLGEQDLFSKTRIFVLESCLSKYDFDTAVLDKLAASKNTVIFIEEKIDKRLSGSKLFLAHKKVEVKEFPLPHGAALDAWIVKRAAELKGAISKPAASLLAKKLGRDDAVETKFGGKVVDVKEVYNLWQVQSEIEKLLSYAAGREITEVDVEELASEDGEVDTLKIVNAIGENNRQMAMGLINGFLNQGGDDKSRIIQLNALLGEQFRNIFVVQNLLAQRLQEQEILEKTSWKSGRLFVLKKIAARFPAQKVADLLDKLAHLDEELKSSSTPPRVLLDLILAQLLV